VGARLRGVRGKIGQIDGPGQQRCRFASRGRTSFAAAILFGILIRQVPGLGECGPGLRMGGGRFRVCFGDSDGLGRKRSGC
jgi:hypothetical protein